MGQWPKRIRCRGQDYWAYSDANLEALLKLIADGSPRSLEVAARQSQPPALGAVVRELGSPEGGR